jgi:hypothetical protein
MISKDLCVYGTKIDLPIVYILILVPNLVVNRDQYVKMTANVFRIVNLVQLHMMCACRECYFGTNCQLTTKGFGHSLDTIMGYQIRQHESIARQTRAVKVSIAMYGISSRSLVLSFRLFYFLSTIIIDSNYFHLTFGNLQKGIESCFEINEKNCVRRRLHL